jgi:hypothetical protein
MCLMKMLLGLIAMALISSAVYTFVSYPHELWIPYSVLVLAAVSLYCLFVVGPLAAILIWRDWISFTVFMLSLAALTFFIFFGWNLISFGSATKYVEGGRVLVEDWSITASGYAKSFFDSAISALVAALGGLVFWFLALRKSDSGSPEN